MAYDVTATFQTEQARIYGSFPIDMYVLNASYSGEDNLYFWNGNTTIKGWIVNGNDELGATEVNYTGLPIARDLINTNVDGEIGGLNVSIPNVDRTLEIVIQGKRYLRGCSVWIVTGFARNLPASTLTYEHVGENPDRYAFLIEKLYVDTVTSNEQTITFQCKPKFDLKHAVMPSRRFMRECVWALRGDYLGTECDPLSKINTASYPTCDGSLEACRTRHNLPRYGGFPTIPRKGVVVL